MRIDIDVLEPELVLILPLSAKASLMERLRQDSGDDPLSTVLESCDGIVPLVELAQKIVDDVLVFSFEFLVQASLELGQVAIEEVLNVHASLDVSHIFLLERLGDEALACGGVRKAQGIVIVDCCGPLIVVIAAGEEGAAREGTRVLDSHARERL